MSDTDQILINKFISGNEKAFTALVIKWQSHILNFAYQFLGNKEMACDILQEVLLRLYLSLNKFRKDAKFSTFLHRIIINCCIDTIRKKHYKTESVFFDDLDNNSENCIIENSFNTINKTPLDVAHEENIGEKVRKALMELPENQRIVLIMKEYSQLTFSEIAQVTDIPETTVKSRMYKGLLNMRKILKHRGIKEWSDIK